MKYEIKQMLKQKYGAIVNTSSVGALKTTPGFCAYCASKSGLTGLSRAAALEYADSGIRVNLILPGPTERTLLLEYLTSTQPEVKNKMLSEIPMKRLAQPEDMAEAVVWLFFHWGLFLSGHVMPVDGGMVSM
jgi:NAD(P)-dependent dehydrogenase (short-subunit alcohol dehydrogenase family)